MFSSLRQHLDVPMNRLYAERARREQAGEPVIDLVSGNWRDPTFHFPQAALQKALAEGLRATRSYRPDPLGKKAARAAISRFYERDGLTIPPEQILLTPGTSLSYFYAFRLLADVEDEILCPLPSYPLFDVIARLAHVRLVYYPLRPTAHEAARWAIDFEGIKAVITPRTRAIVLISPHNPTGAVASAAEVRELCRLAREQDVAVISDEVFSPFLFSSRRLARPVAEEAPLVLTLNGFSKMFALPGLKIGWMAVTGDTERVRQAVQTLEVISDTFLPVQEAAQAAVPALFESGRGFAQRYRAEARRRMAAAGRELRRLPEFQFIPPDGGFYFTVRFTDEGLDDERFAFEALRQEGILIHPGFFYELGDDSFVMSGMIKPDVFRHAARTLAKLARDVR